MHPNRNNIIIQQGIVYVCVHILQHQYSETWLSAEDNNAPRCYNIYSSTCIVCYCSEHLYTVVQGGTVVIIVIIAFRDFEGCEG